MSLFATIQQRLSRPAPAPWLGQDVALRWHKYDIAVIATRDWCTLRRGDFVVRLKRNDFAIMAQALADASAAASGRQLYSSTVALEGREVALATDPGHHVVCLGPDGAMRLPVAIATDLAEWLTLAQNPSLDPFISVGTVRVHYGKGVARHISLCEQAQDPAHLPLLASRILALIAAGEESVETIGGLTLTVWPSTHACLAHGKDATCILSKTQLAHLALSLITWS